MLNQQNKGLPPESEGHEHEHACGVSEDQFPDFEKCCSSANGLTGTAYHKVCSHCDIWTSLPNSESLAVTVIIECECLGYGKRIEE